MKRSFLSLAAVFFLLLTGCSGKTAGVADVLKSGSGAVRGVIQGVRDTAEWTQKSIKDAAKGINDITDKAGKVVKGVKKIGQGIVEAASGAGL